LEFRNRSFDDKVPETFIRFVNANTNCFERSLEEGHITASAWIVDPGRKLALLVHHKKLNLWLQPGGHCDGDPDVVKVAKKEVKEETGLRDFSIFAEEIFDLDIHKIPEWNSIPAHYHYDVRFLIYADSELPLTMNHESNYLRWFNLPEIRLVSPDASVIRLVEKVSLKLGC
jgi:8-oxo-dGTP pyrophosphatase MutT (NUDIX family)